MTPHYHTLDSTGRCVLPDCPDRVILFAVPYMGGIIHSDGTDVVYSRVEDPEEMVRAYNLLMEQEGPSAWFDDP